MKNKSYEVEVQFVSTCIKVSAANKREAVRKVKDKLKGVSAHRYLDKKNLFIYER